jgi:hypothetical protein
MDAVDLRTPLSVCQMRIREGSSLFHDDLILFGIVPMSLEQQLGRQTHADKRDLGREGCIPRSLQGTA